jgi:hypothetical protein
VSRWLPKLPLVPVSLCLSLCRSIALGNVDPDRVVEGVGFSDLAGRVFLTHPPFIDVEALIRIIPPEPPITRLKLQVNMALPDVVVS